MRLVSSVPSSFLAAPKMIILAPGFSSDLSPGTKVDDRRVRRHHDFLLAVLVFDQHVLAVVAVDRSLDRGVGHGAVRDVDPRAGTLRRCRAGLPGTCEPRPPSGCRRARGMADTPMIGAELDVGQLEPSRYRSPRNCRSCADLDVGALARLDHQHRPSTLSMLPRIRTVGGCWAIAPSVDAASIAIAISGREKPERYGGMNGSPVAPSSNRHRSGHDIPSFKLL